MIDPHPKVKAPARYLAAVSVALGAFAAGCVTPHRSAVCDVDPFAWSEAAEIAYANADTLTRYDAALFLRCNGRFTEDTLTVRVATLTPDSLRFVECVCLHIPDTEHPAALVREAVIPYRQRVCLAREGVYRFSVTPLRTVRGVEAAGIHLTEMH